MNFPTVSLCLYHVILMCSPSAYKIYYSCLEIKPISNRHPIYSDVVLSRQHKNRKYTTEGKRSKVFIPRVRQTHEGMYAFIELLSLMHVFILNQEIVSATRFKVL